MKNVGKTIEEQRLFWNSTNQSVAFGLLAKMDQLKDRVFITFEMTDGCRILTDPYFRRHAKWKLCSKLDTNENLSNLRK